MYAQVIDNSIQTVGRLPASARRLDTGAWVMGLDTAPADAVAACGWLPLVDPGRPAPADGQTVERSVELVEGIPTVVWTQRPLTADEAFAREQAQAPDVTTALAARLAADSPAALGPADRGARRIPARRNRDPQRPDLGVRCGRQHVGAGRVRLDRPGLTTPTSPPPPRSVAPIP